MAAEEGFKHIQFSRLKDLSKVKKIPDEMDEVKYVANATNFRHGLLSNYGDENFDASLKVHEDEDTCLTYRGYIKFLMTDLEDVYPIGPERSKSQFKKGIEYIAKQMLFRGDVRQPSTNEPLKDFTLTWSIFRHSQGPCERPSPTSSDCRSTHRLTWRTRSPSAYCQQTHLSQLHGTAQ